VQYPHTVAPFGTRLLQWGHWKVRLSKFLAIMLSFSQLKVSPFLAALRLKNQVMIGNTMQAMITVSNMI
jgi:hypothetical protein